MSDAPREDDRRSRQPGAWSRAVLALVVKEAKQLVRDPSSWIIAVFLPLMFLFLFGYGLSLDTTTLKIALVREDASREARSVAAAFERSRWFVLVPASDRAAAERLLRDQAVKAVIIVPSDFGYRTSTDIGTPRIQVLADGAEPNTANFVRAYVNAVWAGWLAATARELGASLDPPVTVSPRFWFNANAESRWFLIPGSMTVIMTLIGTLLTALVIVRELERGTLEALYATPLTRGQILLGKTIPYFVLAMLSMLMCIVAALTLFGLPLRGSPWVLGALGAAFVIPALGQGLLISSSMKTQLAAAQLGLMTGYLPAIMLSGFLFDIHSMPTWVQWITLIVPARYMNASLQTVFLAGNVWEVLVPNAVFMLLVGALFFALTWRRLVKRIA